MIALKNKPNVIAPTSTYPHGRLKDDTGANDGTPITQQTNNDLHSFVQQLMVDGGVMPNNILENEYDGFQINEALGRFIKKIILQNVNPYVDGLWQASNQGTYGANWGDGSQPPQFRKTRNGTCVQLQGTALRTGTYTTPETIYTLPIGYRPSVARLVTGWCTALQTAAVLSIATTGIITVNLNSGSVGSADVHLDNIEFVL